MGLFRTRVNDPYDTRGGAEPLARAARDRDAARREHSAAEAEFRRQRGLPEDTIICGQDSDPGRLGDAARRRREADDALRAARATGRRGR